MALPPIELHANQVEPHANQALSPIEHLPQEGKNIVVVKNNKTNELFRSNLTNIKNGFLSLKESLAGVKVKLINVKNNVFKKRKKKNAAPESIATKLNRSVGPLPPRPKDPPQNLPGGTFSSPTETPVGLHVKEKSELSQTGQSVEFKKKLNEQELARIAGEARMAAEAAMKQE